MSTGVINIEVRVDDSGAVKIRELGQTAKTAGDTGKRGMAEMEGGLKGVDRQSGITLGSLTRLGGIFAGALSVAAITSRATAFLDQADAMAKLSQSTGLTVGALTAYQHVAVLSGTSIESLSGSVNILNRNILDSARGTGEAQAAFRILGISVHDAAGGLKDADSVLLEVADKLAGMEDGSAKSALAMRIFGRSGADLIPMLNAGADGIQAMKDEAESLGLVLDLETAQATERINDNMTRMRGAMQGVTNQIMAGLLPTFENATEMMLDMRTETGFLDGAIIILDGTLKALMTTGAVIGAVFQTLGTIIGAVGAALMSAVDGEFRQALDILDMGSADIEATWNNLGERLQKIWSEASEAAEQSGGRQRAESSEVLAALEALGEGGEESLKKVEAAAKAKADAMTRLNDEWAKLTLTAEDYAELQVWNWYAQEREALGGTIPVLEDVLALKLALIDADRIAATVPPDHWMGLAEARLEAETRTAEERKKVEEEWARKAQEINEQVTANRLADLSREVEGRRQAGADAVQLAIWEADQLDRIYRDELANRKRMAGDFNTFFRASLAEKLADYRTHDQRQQALYEESWQAFGELADGALDTVGGLFKGVFSDMIRGELRSFKDYWESFLNSLLGMFVDFVAELAAAWLKNAALSALAGTSLGQSLGMSVGSTALSMGGGSGGGSGVIGTVGSAAMSYAAKWAAAQGWTGISAAMGGASSGAIGYGATGAMVNHVAIGQTAQSLAALGQTAQAAATNTAALATATETAAASTAASGSGAGAGAGLGAGAVMGGAMAVGVAMLWGLGKLFDSRHADPAAYSATAGDGITGQAGNWEHFRHLAETRLEYISDAFTHAGEQWGVDLSDIGMAITQNSYDVLGSSIQFVDDLGNTLAMQARGSIHDFTAGISDEAKYAAAAELSAVGAVITATLQGLPPEIRAQMERINLYTVEAYGQGFEQIKHLTAQEAAEIAVSVQGWAASWDQMSADANMAIANFTGQSDYYAQFVTEMTALGQQLLATGQTIGESFNQVMSGVLTTAQTIPARLYDVANGQPMKDFEAGMAEINALYESGAISAQAYAEMQVQLIDAHTDAIEPLSRLGGMLGENEGAMHNLYGAYSAQTDALGHQREVMEAVRNGTLSYDAAMQILADRQTEAAGGMLAVSNHARDARANLDSAAGAIGRLSGMAAQLGGARRPEGMAAGGWVGGAWNGRSGLSGDTIPAILTPGEAVIPRDQAQRHAGLINAMIDGRLVYAAGGVRASGVGDFREWMGGGTFDPEHLDYWRNLAAITDDLSLALEVQVALRHQELEAMSGAERELALMVWAAEDAANALGAYNDWLKAIGQFDPKSEFANITDWMAQLGYRGLGQDQFVASTRGMGMEELQALADQLGITFQELMETLTEAEQYYQAVARERLGLEMQIAQLLGDTASMQALVAEQRRLELEQMDESLRPLQERVWALQDEAAAHAAMETAARAYLSGLQQELAKLEQAHDQALGQYMGLLRQEVAAIEQRADDARQNYLGLLNEELTAHQQMASALRTAVDGLRTYREQMLIGQESPLMAWEQRGLLSSRLSETITQAMLGDVRAMSDLTSISGQYLDVSRRTRTDWRDYGRDFARTRLALEAVEEMAGEQLSHEELQIARLESVIEEVTGVQDRITNLDDARRAYEEAKHALDRSWMAEELARLEALSGTVTDLDEARRIYEAAKHELDNNWYQAEIEKLEKLLGVNQDIRELQGQFLDALKNAFPGEDLSVRLRDSERYQQIGVTYAPISSGWSTSGSAFNNQAAIIRDIESSFRAIQSGNAYSQAFVRMLDTVGKTYSEWTEDILWLKRQSELVSSGTRKFATGAVISGPMSGYRMPDAEFHGTEVILPLNTPAGRAHLHDEGVAAEIRALRTEVSAMSSALARHTSETARASRYLERSQRRRDAMEMEGAE